MGAEEFLVDVDRGVRVFCVAVGDGPQTVLVTNACFMSNDFDRLAGGRRIVFIDSRGRGGSDPVDDVAAVPGDSPVDDLEAVRRHLGAGTVSVIGWSAGGATACVYAMTYPEHVDRVLTVGWTPPRRSPPGDDHLAEIRRRAEARHPADALRSIEELERAGVDRSDPERFARERFFATVAYQTANPERVRSMRSAPWRFRNEHGERWRVLLEHLGSAPRRPHGTVLEQPRLVLFGDGDRAAWRPGDDFRWELRDTRLLLLGGVGHYPWLEDPDAFFPAADEFLSGHWPDAAERIG